MPPPTTVADHLSKTRKIPCLTRIALIPSLSSNLTRLLEWREDHEIMFCRVLARQALDHRKRLLKGAAVLSVRTFNKQSNAHYNACKGCLRPGNPTVASRAANCTTKRPQDYNRTV